MLTTTTSFLSDTSTFDLLRATYFSERTKVFMYTWQPFGKAYLKIEAFVGTISFSTFHHVNMHYTVLSGVKYCYNHKTSFPTLITGMVVVVFK